MSHIAKRKTESPPSSLSNKKPRSLENEINSIVNKEKMISKVNGKKSQPKKLVIKMAAQPQLPANFEEERWQSLTKAVDAIQNSFPVTTSLEELYQATEDLCQHKFAATIYSRLQTQCENHIKTEVKKLVGQTADPLKYLILVHNCWDDHCKHMLLIRSIFLYLDRTFVIQNSNVRSLWDMGLQLFRLHIMMHPEIQRKTVSGILNLIESERKGDSVDRLLLKNLLRMFVSLGIYTETFGKPFLEATNQFYNAEGITCIRDFEIPEYLKHIERRLHEESDRVLHYLDAETRKPLILAIETQLIENHVDAILLKGFDELVDANRKEDLKRMYALFSRVNCLDKLKSAWNNYIKTTGTHMVTDPEKDKSLVQELLDLKLKLDIILQESFANNEKFSYSLKEGFETFINSRANKPAELIAKFVDLKLRTHKGSTEDELEQILDKVLVLFRFVQGKDVFEAFYKKDLAKRLLLGKSGSYDAEKSMISKLKTECGASFTNKLEGMFKDMDLSADIMSSFKESPEYRKLGRIELQVYVLTQSYWPAYPPIELNIPEELAQYQEVFKKFYLSKHNGRKLMWQNALGQCVLKAKFPLEKHPKELIVSLFQTIVLLLFNEKNKLSFKEIEQGTSMDENELKRTLLSLACGKVRVLTKTGQAREIEETDEFEFNKEFKQKMFRIKINSVQMKETVEENKKTTDTVMADRQYQIDAAIVRIMKTRKKLTHALLVSELYNQLKFPVKPSDLKKRIESLIEREYLERDSQDQQVFHYLA